MQKITSMLSVPLTPEMSVRSTWRGFRKAAAFMASLIVVLGLWTSTATAQHVVTGEVIDADDGTSLPGVNLIVKGTTIGTATRFNGEFIIDAPSPGDTLLLSFVGYILQEVPIDGRTNITIPLERSVTSLGEVIVSVPYGTQTVATTTGSVSQISGEALEQIPTTNLTQSLQGTVAGLIGVTGNGSPGRDNSTLLIRGTSTLGDNAPLIVIDGVPGRQGGLARLNPSDIESVSVLKDASAAIYGSRAANGVILVRTKQGKPGKARVSVNVERSYATPAVVPEMANSETYMSMLNEIDVSRGNPERFSQEQIAATTGDISGRWDVFNTDWYDVALNDFSREISANAAVTGGSETVRYRVSLEGLTEDGILVNSASAYEQLGFRSNISGDVTDNFNVAFNLHGRLEDRNNPAWTRGGAQDRGAWELLQRGKPNEPAFWPNGLPGPAQENGVNPVVANETGFDNRKTYYFQSSLSLGLDIAAVQGWSVEGTVAYDRTFEDYKRWQQPWTLYNCAAGCSGEDDLIATTEGVPEPRLTQADFAEEDILLRATSLYEPQLGSDHTASLLLGTEFQRNENNSLFLFRRFFLSDQITELFAGGTGQQNLSGNSDHAARLNFFGRLNYNFQQKYLVELVARYDGSYIFPEDDRFGFFPSISAGWRLAQEDWFNDATGGFFDRLKLRAAYGQTGNDSIEPYQFLSTFGFNGAGFAFGDGLGPRISPTRVPNEDITWEVATQFDVGLQGGIFDERVSFELTYFNHFRDDILWFRNVAVPQTAGFSLPRENIAQVRSKGFEAELSFSEQISSNVRIRGAANISFANDEVEFFDEPEGVLPHQQNTGSPWNTNLYYLTDGVYNDQAEVDAAPAWGGARPGDIKFVDFNEDGVINGDDRVRIDENGTPNVIGAFNLGASIGNFDVSMLWQGASGVKQRVISGAVGEFGNYFQAHTEDRWTPENPDGEMPRAWNRQDPYWASQLNDFFLEDAKYLRLKTARIGYTLPERLTNRIGGMDQVLIYLTGRNLLTFSPLEIFDPELRNRGGQEYPLEKAFTLGIQLGF
ncbi:MAG: SusC/RagA family TonB-linked outer membrane protein [Rhodothermales bacterium]